MNPSPKQVLIAGGYGFGNTGDDAILKVLVDELQAAVPDVVITVLSWSPQETHDIYDVRSLFYRDIGGLMRAADQCDLMIIGGGGLFYDYNGVDADSMLSNRHAEISYFAGLSLLATMLGKPLMMYAVGVGPLRTEEGRKLTRVAFEQARVATVRDAESRALLEAIGVDINRVTATADPAFSLQSADRAVGRGHIEAEAGDSRPRPWIAVSIRRWNLGDSTGGWESEVAVSLDQFLTQQGGTVFLTPFHRRDNDSLADDPGLAKQLFASMELKTQVVILSSEYSPEERASILANCDLVLGMRLHAVIFAAKAAVPFVAITYDPKVNHLLTLMKCEEYGIDPSLLTSARLLDLMTMAFENRDSLHGHLKKRVQLIEPLCRNNSQLLADTLHGKFPPALPPSTDALDMIKKLALRPLFEKAQSEAVSTGISTSRELRAEGLSAAGIARAIQTAKAAANEPRRSEHNANATKRREGAPRVAILVKVLPDSSPEVPDLFNGASYGLTLGRLLRDLGLEVTFYRPRNKPFKHIHEGFQVEEIRFTGARSEFERVGDEFFQSTLDFDHVVYDSAEFVSERIREDAILVSHGLRSDESNFRSRTPRELEDLFRAFARPLRVISVDTNAINIVRALWPEAATRMTYIPNWVNLDAFRPPTSRDRGQQTVIFPKLGRSIDSLRFVESILHAIPDECRFLLVEERNAEEPRSLIALARRDFRISVLAATPNEMPRYYSEAGICVISGSGNEGDCLSTLEGLASGCAVVATHLGGLPNLITSEVNGLLVEPEAPAFAEAVNRLIESAEDRARFQQTGRATAAHYSPEIWRQRWTTVLRELGWV
jgi:polysaccharide pyruvyl transferase CsaB